MAETISAMPRATAKVKKEMTSQPMDIVALEALECGCERGAEVDLRATGVQSVAEEGGDACDDRLSNVSFRRNHQNPMLPTIIENEMPKLCISPQSLFNSCL